jgi:hypothetical protein
LILLLAQIFFEVASFGGDVRYWAESLENGSDGWGGRLVFALLFPK